jgi:oligopeptide/dipeptide ABC transporter ATP-binding protein
MSLLTIEDLTVEFPGGETPVRVIENVSLEVGKGEFVGLVGESGSGKTMTALSIMRLVPNPGKISTGRISFAGEELLTKSDAEMRKVRGARIGMIFQEPMTALNPVFTIGFQIVEALRVHRTLSMAEARKEAVRLLDLVAIPDAAQRVKDYPHQLSGGQRQRAMIAMTLACEPDLLLADEPTTALDVTIQAQILELLERLRHELGLALLLITHDLSVVAETCDRVLVMYSGRLVEEASVDHLFAQPTHPYTQGLLSALPRLGQPHDRGHLPSIPGQIPDPAVRPSGCVFHPRCSEAFEPCSGLEPPLYSLKEDQSSRCFLYSPTEGQSEGRES